jgi:MoxR-like ATPase
MSSSLSSALDLATRTQVPLLIWGSPGVGKSAAVRYWASQRGLECWTVIASLREPSDFSGLPVVAAQAGGASSVDFVPPRFATQAAERGGVIFLDELTTAPPAVQAALLRAVLDKAFGDLQLDPSKVTVVAAANPPEQAAAGWDLSPPLANRFLHHDHSVSATEWTEIGGFPSYWGAPPPIRFGQDGIDVARWTQARNLVADFIRRKPDILLAVPSAASAQGRAWPSPRSWDHVSRLVASWGNSKADVPSNLGAIAGCVGEGAAREFVEFVSERDLQDPEEILANPASYRHPPRGDQRWAVMNAVVLAAASSITATRWAAAWEFLAALRDNHQSGDVAFVGARFLAHYRTRGSTPLQPVPAMIGFMKLLGLSGI